MARALRLVHFLRLGVAIVEARPMPRRRPASAPAPVTEARSVAPDAVAEGAVSRPPESSPWRDPSEFLAPGMTPGLAVDSARSAHPTPRGFPAEQDDKAPCNRSYSHHPPPPILEQ